MSESPFVPTTTPAIERANRLLGVRAHPGFLDLLRILQDISKTADENCADYPGWDTQQIVVLKVRMQAAHENHKLFLVKINEAIEAGVAEARESSLPKKSAEEALEQGDYVRQKTLEKFDEMDARVPGSY